MPEEYSQELYLVGEDQPLEESVYKTYLAMQQLAFKNNNAELAAEIQRLIDENNQTQQSETALNGNIEVGIGTNLNIAMASGGSGSSQSLPVPPSLLAMNIASPPDLIDVDMYLRYSSEFLDSVIAYIIGILNGSDTVLASVKRNNYLLEDGRNEEAVADALMRETQTHSGAFWAFPTTSLTAVGSKLGQEFSFETAKISRDRIIDQELRAIDGIKFALQQSVAIEEMLIAYGPAMAEELAKIASLEADAYVASISMLTKKNELIIEMYKAELSTAVANGKIALAVQDVGISGQLLEASNEKAVAEVNLARERVQNDVSFYGVNTSVMKGAATSSVTSHGIASQIASSSVRVSTSTAVRTSGQISANFRDSCEKEQRTIIYSETESADC